MDWKLVLTIAVAGVSCAACINMNNPTRLAPGASADEVQRLLGVPTGRYALDGGAQRLEYARGPYGRETWMLDLDASGRLLSSTQVLTEKRFNSITAGMTADDVLKLIGRPSATSRVGWKDQAVWSYRYQSTFCQWFQIGMGKTGLVEDTGYYPDPICDDVDKPLFGFWYR